MASNCDKFYLVVSGDECGTIASNEGISLDDFYSWNPAVGTSCQYLDLGDYVCIGVEACTSTSCSITTTATSTTPTATGNGIPTPTPYQTGMASNCDNFYLVVSGDECGTIASNEGISLADFYAWNPAVGTSCQYLGLGDYVCIGVETCTSASVLTTPSQGGLTCGAPGASHDNSGSLLIESYTAGSPYVESAAACGAQCLATTSCTNLYFIEGSYCNLHEGASTWELSTDSPEYLWYEAECFSPGSCGALGASHDNSGSLLIESYTAGSPYVDSAGACGAQCLATSSCTNLYFIEGSYCNLHEGASTFAASNATGSYSWYDASCFSSGEACGSFGLSDDVSSTLLVSYTSGSAYVESAAACGAQCLSTSDCTNVYFIDGSYCNLHSPSTFQAASASNYYEWYQAGCFACNALS
jgi:LysM domain